MIRIEMSIKARVMIKNLLMIVVIIMTKMKIGTQISSQPISRTAEWSPRTKW